MPKVLQYLGQAVFFIAVAAVIGFFSNRPEYRNFPPDMAQIKLSFSHGAERVEECRRLTTEEISELPKAERRPNTCARERVTLRIQMRLNGDILYDREIAPSGLSADGPARVYEEFAVPAGTHELELKLRDNRAEEGFDHRGVFTVDLAARENVAIDFQSDAGGFVLR